MPKKICVIIPARGKALKLTFCIKSVLACAGENPEIILVDDGLDEEALNALDTFQDKIKILKSFSAGPSFARNLAARSTDAEFLGFTDSDCIVDKNWLNELCRAFQEYPQASSCGGRQESPPDAAGFEKRVFSFMQKCAFFADYSRPAKKETIFEVEHNPSCCVMYKRDAFIKAGGFLEGLWPGEDVELDYRLKKAGAKIIFNPGAIVYHYRPGDLDSFLKMMSRYGWAQGALVRKYGFFRPIQYLPLIGFLFIILIFVCLFFSVQVFTSILAIVFFLGLVYFKFNIMLLTMAVLVSFSWNLGFFKGLARRL